MGEAILWDGTDHVASLQAVADLADRSELPAPIAIERVNISATLEKESILLREVM